MSTSKQTFSQVKDILRKLDRSIEDAKARRLNVGPGSSAGRPVQPLHAAAQPFQSRHG